MRTHTRLPPRADIFKGMDGEGQDVRSSPFLIESEIKHGRLAMLAAVGYPAAELLHPFIADAVNLPSLLTEVGAAPNFLNGGLEALVAKFNLTLVFVVVASYKLRVSGGGAAMCPRRRRHTCNCCCDSRLPLDGSGVVAASSCFAVEVSFCSYLVSVTC